MIVYDCLVVYFILRNSISLKKYISLFIINSILVALVNRNTSTSLFYTLKIVDFLVPDKILENWMVL